MKSLFVCCLLIGFSAASAWAQSLKPQDPAPLQPGINQGTIDNFVGAHYWYFTGGPGHVHLHAQFKSMSVLGNASQSQSQSLFLMPIIPGIRQNNQFEQ